MGSGGGLGFFWYCVAGGIGGGQCVGRVVVGVVKWCHFVGGDLFRVCVLFDLYEVIGVGSVCSDLGIEVFLEGCVSDLGGGLWAWVPVVGLLCVEVLCDVVEVMLVVCVDFERVWVSVERGDDCV